MLFIKFDGSKLNSLGLIIYFKLKLKLKSM